VVGLEMLPPESAPRVSGLSRVNPLAEPMVPK
jgi:hypothetical protein